MKITKLKLTKRGDRVSIFVDKEFAFAVGRNLIVDFGLYEGKELSGKELDEIRKREFFIYNYTKVLNLILRRPRSEQEVRIYLRRKWDKDREDESLLESIVDKLREEEYLDDFRFAKWWIKNRKAFKPRGKFLISLELTKKGVEKEIIKKAFREVGFAEEDEVKFAEELAEKRFEKYSRFSKLKTRKKLSDYLSRKGFSYQIIKKVLEDLLV
jgi:regulatory protein